MIMVDSIDKAHEPDMGYYYKLRKQVRNLYANDIKINPGINDLASRILQLRDKHKCVEGINLDTTNSTIDINIEEGTEQATVNKIYNQTTSILDNYIKENVNLYEKDSTKHDEVKNFKLYDGVIVGNTISIVL